MTHGGVIVNHCRHAVRRLTAVALKFPSRVASAHQCADPGGCNPRQQCRQEKNRSCGSSRHVRKLYLRLYELRKLAQGLLPTEVFLSPREKRVIPEC
jgi:hypothetical protein